MVQRTAVPPLTLRQLRLLVAFADHGTVTAAAQAERVTQPAMSQALRALERRFNLPLTTRVGRRLILTSAAQVVVDYARRIVRLTEEAEAAGRELAGLQRGTLSVGASTTPGTYLLPALLGAFHARHPDVRLGLRIGDTHEVVEWVRSGAVDFGVIGETREELGLVARPFRTDELILVAPASHPLATARRVTPEALAATPLVVRESGSSTRETLERALATRGLAVQVLFELGSTEAILQAVAAGLGASVVSELAAAHAPRGSRLVARRVDGLDLGRHLAVVEHPDARLGPAAAQFLEVLTRTSSR